MIEMMGMMDYDVALVIVHLCNQLNNSLTDEQKSDNDMY